MIGALIAGIGSLLGGAASAAGSAASGVGSLAGQVVSTTLSTAGQLGAGALQTAGAVGAGALKTAGAIGAGAAQIIPTLPAIAKDVGTTYAGLKQAFDPDRPQQPVNIYQVQPQQPQPIQGQLQDILRTLTPAQPAISPATATVSMPQAELTQILPVILIVSIIYMVAKK